jgi:hypothetical protein
MAHISTISAARSRRSDVRSKALFARTSCNADKMRGRIMDERDSMAAETRKNHDSEGVPVNVFSVVRLSSVNRSPCLIGKSVA